MAIRLIEADTSPALQHEAFPHALPSDRLLASLGVDQKKGLSASLVAERQRRFGFNELAEAPPIPSWRKLLRQFNEVVIWVLIVAAVASGLLGEWTDAGAILAIVLLNGLLGFFQEQKADRALAALQKLSAPMAKVIRNGMPQAVPARELVLGDRIELEAGDNIPADARLLETRAFLVQEASLTGESATAEKEAECVLDAVTVLGDRRNMVYMGTMAAVGRASAIVVATGMNTELGRIAGLLQRYEPEPTPLQKRLAELGRVLALGCLAIVVLVFVLELLKGGNLLEVFLLSVSLAVAAVPEGLPAVVTITLTLGLQRMIQRNALIRRLASVETLGSVTVICSDKTGTLTRNEMTVREVFAGGCRYRVSGTGYNPHGEFNMPSAGEGIPATPIDPQSRPDLLRALTIGARCNNARITPRGEGSESWSVLGDPTEGALMVVALKAGIDSTRPPLLYEIPFDAERKAMSVVLHDPEAGVAMYTKGAPEMILARCQGEQQDGQVMPLDENRRRHILDVGTDMASRALRLLALAFKKCPEKVEIYDEQDLVFAGLVGMIDPPREEVTQAVKKCHEAGIRPIMITGDHPATALAIATELGIARRGERVITGQDLSRLSDEDLAQAVDRISVYARVAPEHKLRIVRAWKSQGPVVAMTGDGVNDAPAVKAADIGIAMGISGTDVTKEASAMVLTDDNFASIVNAVEEGRGILDNIQKFLHYLLAGNIGLILFVFFAALVGWPFPLTAIQILWINLVTNGLPALALGMEPPEPDLMRRPPRPPFEPIISMRRGGQMLLEGFLVATVTALGFALVYQGNDAYLPRARTLAFCLIAYAFVFYSLACRSQRFTLLQLGFFSNPYLLAAIAISGLLQLSVIMLPYAHPVFDTGWHPAWEWLTIALLALLPVTLIESSKWLRKY